MYVLTNASMPDLVKIGITRNIEQRMKTLYTTGVPLPFDLHYAVQVNNPKQVERALQEAFAPDRINDKREFFEVSAERVVAILRVVGGTPVDENRIIGDGQDDSVDTNEPTEITDEDIVASQKRTRKKSAFNFTQEGIPKGAILTFSRDPEITVEVISDRKISYQGEETSLSKVAEDILVNQHDWNPSRGVRGPEYWEYQGELLTERRKRREREQNEYEDTE